jgi:hypothetical protein
MRGVAEAKRQDKECLTLSSQRRNVDTKRKNISRRGAETQRKEGELCHVLRGIIGWFWAGMAAKMRVSFGNLTL